MSESESEESEDEWVDPDDWYDIYEHQVIGEDDWTFLHDAVVKDRADLIENSLNANMDEMVDSENESGDTPIYLAAQLGHLACLKALIGVGADIHHGDSQYGLTPLHSAAREGNAACVTALIAAGAKVDEVDEAGNTSLAHAAYADHDACVAALVEAGADVDKKAVNGCTPLLLSIQHSNATIVAKLIAAGADVTCADDHDSTAFHWALEKGSRPILRQLLNAGAHIPRPPLYRPPLGNYLAHCPRDEVNEDAWLYVDKVFKFGYEAHVKKHRRIIMGIIKKALESRFRCATDDVAGHILPYWTPPGGY